MYIDVGATAWSVCLTNMAVTELAWPAQSGLRISCHNLRAPDALPAKGTVGLDFILFGCGGDEGWARGCWWLGSADCCS